MDGVLTEQSIATSTNKKQNRMKTAKKNGRGTNFISNNNSPSENFDAYAGILNPPSRAMSLSYTYSLGQNQQQPPLLPLPSIHHSHPQLPRSVSGFNHRNRTREMSLATKKSKPTKREEAKKRSGSQSLSDFLIIASDNRWGPDPKDIPKNLPVVLSPGTRNIDDVFSDSVFNLAPPPSSLPFPKFSLRSKLSCNTEAAGSVDAGATNNLRRILRLR